RLRATGDADRPAAARRPTAWRRCATRPHGASARDDGRVSAGEGLDDRACVYWAHGGFVCAGRAYTRCRAHSERAAGAADP
ncbi:hypothetical protein ABTO75_19175, partial [Acinetobacter baumannii]